MKNLTKWQPRHARDNENVWGIIVDGTMERPEWIMTPNPKMDQTDVVVICGAHNAVLEKDKSLMVSSLVNVDLEPILQIAMGAEVAQFTMKDADQILRQVTQGIEAAMSDALVCRFVRDYVYKGEDSPTTQRAIGQILVMFRQFRESILDPSVIVEGGKPQ